MGVLTQIQLRVAILPGRPSLVEVGGLFVKTRFVFATIGLLCVSLFAAYPPPAHAVTVTIFGVAGTDGVDGVGAAGSDGGPGGAATAITPPNSDPNNTANATGGNGGAGDVGFIGGNGGVQGKVGSRA
jgi:hypothetical protein